MKTIGNPVAGEAHSRSLEIGSKPCPHGYVEDQTSGPDRRKQTHRTPRNSSPGTRKLPWENRKAKLPHMSGSRLAARARLVVIDADTI